MAEQVRMDKMTFRLPAIFGIVVMLSSVVFAAVRADDNEHRFGDHRILAGVSASQGDTRRYPMRRQMEKLTEHPDYADVPYGPHERNKLDIWLAGNGAPTPLVVYFHSGGFRGGDKRSIRQMLLSSLLAAGISVAAVNYRLSNTAPYPAQMHDAARAVQFLRYYAAR